jgi:hypothetical protein
MADVAEAVRDTCDSNGGREESCGNGPAEALGPVEESLSRHGVPANLEMHGQSANENLTLSAKLKYVRSVENVLHTAIDMPPAMMKAPENAQVRSEYMSWGVISSKHCSGLAPKGITNPS